ncbi:tigger transposable element-derived protein 6-like [Melanaphis sacchari]|uniref:tigger transposable element-derived protein 6-like n=1 Tax=Melanaphis sacchari TaxID=742174 RepID=UPI000DC15A69|nr:tigger transposable element-derived protein 6-like [Melanaphis sacchari]
MNNNKRKRLNLEEKLNIIKTKETENLSVRVLAERFCISKSQIKLHEWFCRARSYNLPVSGPLLQEKAREVANEVGLENFKASNGWLQKFRERHNISFKNICGEGNSVDTSVVEKWLEKLKTLISDYEPKNIFNCDETGLFFRALPDKTLCLKNEICRGGKIAKDRLTVLLCVNMIGEFETPLIIGKSLKPRCFKSVNVSTLGVNWKANRKAWMNRDLMTDWLMCFNRKMEMENRKIILFLDNASSHPDTLNLKNIKLIFLPPNTTSICQPLDQGIIKNFKVHYRQRLLRHILSRVDQNSGFFSFDTAEYVMENDNVANLDLFSELVPSTIEIEDYVSIDNNILTKDNTLIISDIINCNLDNFSEKETEQLEEQEEEDKDDLIYNPTFEELCFTKE